MAILRREDGKTYSEIREIEQQLNSLNVQIKQLTLENYLVNPAVGGSLRNLFCQEIMNLSEKQAILQALSPQCNKSQHLEGCTWCELMAINPSSPNLYQLLAQGSRPSRHTTDQIIYLLTGECILGFSSPDGGEMELLLHSQDYVKIPAGMRYWFSLSALLSVKAIRYFTSIQYNQHLAEVR
jgi:1,2-dihydroxy-3-keto-5-methylthiopentene dioxygenase